MWRRGSRAMAEPGRNLHLRGGARSGRRPAQGRIRGSRRPAGQEHHAGRFGPTRCLIDGQASDAGHAGARRVSARPQASAKRPSIAVLPFDNMSGDPEQEFFVDGLTEDIITELSRFRELLVISRNAVFVHKGKPVKAQAGRARVRGGLHRRRKRPQGGGSGQGHGSAHRRRDRDAYLGRALRSQARGHLRHPGRDHLVHRFDPVWPGRGRAARPRQAEDHREHGGLRIRVGRQDPPSSSRTARPTSRRFARSSAPSSSIPTTPTPTPGWRA